MKPSDKKKEWNKRINDEVKKLKDVKSWLKKHSKDKTNDWGTKKSAHQALKFLELAEYEMWNMQWWENSKQVDLHVKAENKTPLISVIC